MYCLLFRSCLATINSTNAFKKTLYEFQPLHCLHFDENFMTVALILNGGFCITKHRISFLYILKQSLGECCLAVLNTTMTLLLNGSLQTKPFKNFTQKFNYCLL